MFVEPVISSPGDQYAESLWVREECYRFYVDQRRKQCSYTEILDLWLQAPCCSDCILSDPFRRDERADIMPDDWRMDLLLHLGQAEKVIESTEFHLGEDPEYAFECKRCHHHLLRPWDGDDVWVLNYHLEEHYGIPLEEPGKKKPGKELGKTIRRLYDDRCFRCGETRGLHIDHIRPQSKDGDRAFRNLQPLCEQCGNLKDDRDPDEIEVFNPLYFMPPPPDSWPHLFW